MAAPLIGFSAETADFAEFSLQSAELKVGLNGNVLLTCQNGKEDTGTGYLWVLSPEGKSLLTLAPGRHTTTAASNAQGQTAAAVIHSVHSLFVYNEKGDEVSQDQDFQVGDNYGGNGWNNPAAITATTSGKFYVYDLAGQQIIRYDASGRREAQIPLKPSSFPPEEAFVPAEYPSPDFFQVREKSEEGPTYTVGTRKGVFGFDAEGLQTHFKSPQSGALVGDEEGRVFRVILNEGKSQLQIFPFEFSSDSPPPSSEISLKLSENDLATHPITSVGLHGDHLFIKRNHPTEMFQVYDLNTEELVRTVEIDKP